MQPPASLQALADPIYEAFYGLKEQPFSTSTDPKFLFMSASHHHAFEELVAGLKRREALLLLCGETGTGKTTLCRAVIEALGGRAFSALILNPYMSGAELLRVLLREFGFVSRDEIRRGVLAHADTPELLDALEGFLRSLAPLDTQVVVIIDEAQSLSPQVLDQVRMLTAFEQGIQRLLQVVLVGQPMLLNILKTEPMYALNERITRRVMLSPLPRPDVEAYIRHRLEVAGGADAVTFEPDATKLIGELSRGLPRRVNVICDRTLQEGRIQGATAIHADLVKRATRSLMGAAPETVVDASNPPPGAIESRDAPDVVLGTPRRRQMIALGAGGGLLAASLVGYVMYARSVIGAGPGLPPVSTPIVNAGAPAPALPMPTEDETAATLSAVAQSKTSGQLPDDRHELD